VYVLCIVIPPSRVVVVLVRTRELFHDANYLCNELFDFCTFRAGAATPPAATATTAAVC